MGIVKYECPDCKSVNELDTASLQELLYTKKALIVKKSIPKIPFLERKQISKAKGNKIYIIACSYCSRVNRVELIFQ